MKIIIIDVLSDKYDVLQICACNLYFFFMVDDISNPIELTSVYKDIPIVGRLRIESDLSRRIDNITDDLVKTVESRKSLKSAPVTDLLSFEREQLISLQDNMDKLELELRDSLRNAEFIVRFLKNCRESSDIHYKVVAFVDGRYFSIFDGKEFIINERIYSYSHNPGRSHVITSNHSDIYQPKVSTKLIHQELSPKYPSSMSATPKSPSFEFRNKISNSPFDPDAVPDYYNSRKTASPKNSSVHLRFAEDYGYSPNMSTRSNRHKPNTILTSSRIGSPSVKATHLISNLNLLSGLSEMSTTIGSESSLVTLPRSGLRKHRYKTNREADKDLSETEKQERKFKFEARSERISEWVRKSNRSADQAEKLLKTARGELNVCSDALSLGSKVKKGQHRSGFFVFSELEDAQKSLHHSMYVGSFPNSAKLSGFPRVILACKAGGDFKIYDGIKVAFEWITPVYRVD